MVVLNFGFVEIIKICVLKSKLNTAKNLEKHSFNLMCFFFIQWYIKENLESLVEVSFELNIARFEINCKKKYVDILFVSRNAFEREGYINFRPPIKLYIYIHIGIYIYIYAYVYIYMYRFANKT